MLIHRLRSRSLLGRRRRSDKGFTLVELLVVITILGILAAVVIAAVSGIGDKGEESAKTTDRSILQTALESYCATTDSVVATAGYADIPELTEAGFLSSTAKYNDVDMYPNDGGGATCGTASYAIFTPKKTDYPVTITGCNGKRTTFHEKPKRAMAIDDKAHELSMFLGIDEYAMMAELRMPSVRAPQFAESSVRNLARNPIANYTATAFKVPKLNNLTENTVDFAFTGSGFHMPEVARTETWTTQFSEQDVINAGIKTYAGFMGTPCYNTEKDAEGNPLPRASLEGMFDDIRNLGIIFDVQEKAMELIASMKADIADSIRKVRNARGSSDGLRVLDMVIRNTLDTTLPPYLVSSGFHPGNALIRYAGGQNVFGDEPGDHATQGGYEGKTKEELIAKANGVEVMVLSPFDDPTGVGGRKGEGYCNAVAASMRADTAAGGWGTLPAVAADRFVCAPVEYHFSPQIVEYVKKLADELAAI